MYIVICVIELCVPQTEHIFVRITWNRVNILFVCCGLNQKKGKLCTPTSVSYKQFITTNFNNITILNCFFFRF
jgi:hypothetical protein